MKKYKFAALFAVSMLIFAEYQEVSGSRTMPMSPLSASSATGGAAKASRMSSFSAIAKAPLSVTLQDGKFSYEGGEFSKEDLLLCAFGDPRVQADKERINDELAIKNEELAQMEAAQGSIRSEIMRLRKIQLQIQLRETLQKQISRQKEFLSSNKQKIECLTDQHKKLEGNIQSIPAAKEELKNFFQSLIDINWKLMAHVIDRYCQAAMRLEEEGKPVPVFVVAEHLTEQVARLEQEMHPDELVVVTQFDLARASNEMPSIFQNYLKGKPICFSLEDPDKMGASSDALQYLYHNVHDISVIGGRLVLLDFMKALSEKDNSQELVENTYGKRLEANEKRQASLERKAAKHEARLRSLQSQKSKVARSISASSSAVSDTDQDLDSLRAQSRANLQAIKERREGISRLESELSDIDSASDRALVILRIIAQSQPSAVFQYGGLPLNVREIDTCLGLSKQLWSNLGLPKDGLIAEFLKSGSSKQAVQNALFAPSDHMIPIFSHFWGEIFSGAAANQTEFKGIAEALRLLHSLSGDSSKAGMNRVFLGERRDLFREESRICDDILDYFLKHDGKHFMNIDSFVAATGWSDCGEDKDLPLAGSDHGSIGYVKRDGGEQISEKDQEAVTRAALRAIVEDQLNQGGFRILPVENPLSLRIVPIAYPGHGEGFAPLTLRKSLHVEGIGECLLDKALWAPYQEIPESGYIDRKDIVEVPADRVNELLFSVNLSLVNEPGKGWSWKIGGSIYPVVPPPEKKMIE